MIIDPQKEYTCPSCGGTLLCNSHADGWAFQCPALDCMEAFEPEEIVDEEDATYGL